MAALTVNDGSAGFATATFDTPNAGGDTIAVGRATVAGGWQLPVVLLVNNTDAATRTVTVGSQAGVVVPATTGRAIIPVLVGQSAIGTPVPVTYSAVTNLTVLAVRLTAPLA